MDEAEAQRIKDGMAYESQRDGPPEGFPALPIIASGRYTDPDFLALEEKHLWKKSWLYACHMDEISSPGDYLLWNRLGVAIIILHGDDGTVRAFYNTCRHRGAPIVQDETGRKNRLTCPYHGWTYDHRGDLVGMRDPRDFPDFKPDCHSLIQLACAQLGRWVFVNFDAEADPLHDYLGPLAAEMQQFQPDQTRFVHRGLFEVDCNVKILLDAFLETYHLKSIHQNTVDRFLDHLGTTIDLWKNGHSRMITPNRRPDWQDPGTLGLREYPDVSDVARDNNISYLLFPNLVCPPSATGMPFVLFWPKGGNKMVLECVWFSPDWGDGPVPEIWQTRIANFDRIIEEDTQFATRIQTSVESDGFRGISLSYQERRIYHWHERLDQLLGQDEIDPCLRVEAVLDKFIDKYK